MSTSKISAQKKYIFSNKTDIESVHHFVCVCTCVCVYVCTCVCVYVCTCVRTGSA